MNRKQLIVLWVLAAWLAFAVVYSSYYPAHTVGGYLDNGKVWVEEMRYPAEWDFGWQDSILMVLSLPAILIAISLLLTLRDKKSTN